MTTAWRAIGDVVVRRRHLVWTLVWLHAVLIGLPFLEFATRDYETGWESLAWLAIVIEVVGAALLLVLAPVGLAAPLAAVDGGLGLSLLDDGPMPIRLLGAGFLLGATLAGILQWLAIRDWIAWWRKRRSVG